jgi:subtilisin-like proprotein convertase family protein
MVPRLSNLLANTSAFGEILPQVARTLNFRVVARDNASGAGGLATDDVVLTVASAGPFAVTSPNTVVLWSGSRTVTWSVNSTNVAPVSCANVRILLSTDGGNTFPIVLAASTPNDGSESVSLPSITTSQARIKVESIGNIFFDISNVNFSIEPFIPVVSLSGTGANLASDSVPNGNANGFVEPGESSIAVTVPVRNSGDLTATGVTGTLTSLTPTVSVINASANYGTLVPAASASNIAPYIISVSPSHPCGELISLRLAINSAQGSGTYTFSLPTGRTTSITQSVISYTGPAVAIPDNNLAGITRTVTFSGAAGPISDLNVRFDGGACSSAAGAAGVGLTHSWIGDLVITLTAPGGSPSAVIVDRPGHVGLGFGNSGNNLCQTVLDDEAAADIETVPVSAAPFSGSYRPNNPLSVFDGINPVGNWTLRVADVASGETGTLRAFSLIFTRGQLTCDPPASACPGDFNGDGGVDGDDVVAFFADWDAGALGADVNGDGSVDGDDVITFFASWDAGC